MVFHDHFSIHCFCLEKTVNVWMVTIFFFLSFVPDCFLLGYFVLKILSVDLFMETWSLVIFGFRRCLSILMYCIFFIKMKKNQQLYIHTMFVVKCDSGQLHCRGYIYIYIMRRCWKVLVLNKEFKKKNFRFWKMGQTKNFITTPISLTHNVQQRNTTI